MAADKDVDLILVAGQSNAVGFETSPDQLPEDDADRKVLFWWRCGDPPADEFDTSSGQQWTTLQAQPKGDPASKEKDKRQYGNFKNPKGGFGPEMGLARTLCRMQPDRAIAVLKVAYSGTSITEWDPRKSGDPQTCYQALVSETKLAIKKAKEKGVTLHLRALVWVQGESDANEKRVSQYGENLGKMIQSLRKELDAPQLIALVGLNTRFGNSENPFVQHIIEAQKTVAATSEYTEYVDSTGCDICSKAHFDSKGTLEFGKRLAQALIQTEKSGKRD